MLTTIEIKAKIQDDVLFKISRMKEVIKATRPHGHKQYYEIILLTAGAGHHVIDLNQYPVQPPTIYFINPGQIHCWGFTAIPKGYVLIFRADFLDSHAINKADFITLSAFLNACTLSGEVCAELVSLLESTEKDFQADRDAATDKIIASYLQILLYKLKRLLPPSQVEDSSHHANLVKQFLIYLDQYFLEKRQVKEYAALLHISPKYLNDICKKYTNKTASNLIQERLILEGKRLLLHTASNISEIAYKLNFHDSSHFAKFFSRSTGTAPKEYRDQIR